MSNIDEIKNKIDKMRQVDTSRIIKKIDVSIESNQRYSDMTENFDETYDRYYNEFSKKTSILNAKDQTFLWSAVALQTLKWIILPAFDLENVNFKPNYEDRNDAKIEARMENPNNSVLYTTKRRDEAVKYVKEHLAETNSIYEYAKLPWETYFMNSVPYDAMHDVDGNNFGIKNLNIPGVSAVGKNLSGNNHHAATLGHDPVLGYFFGVLNIITHTITFNTPLLPSNVVEINSKRIAQPVGFAEIFKVGVEAGIRERMKIPAAVGRQAMHMASDKYTKTGLQIPFLSAARQQELLKKGWNSKELERKTSEMGKVLAKDLTIAAVQYLLSLLINMIIKSLHIFLYEESDGDLELYSARTSKILAISNTIASSINLAYVGGNVVTGILTENPSAIKNGISKTDVGGMIETARQIYLNKGLQKEIMIEYIEKGFYRDLFNDTKEEGKI